MNVNNKQTSNGVKMSSFLPPPDWLILKGSGIDISDRSIKFVEFKEEREIFGFRKPEIRLKQFGEEVLEEGAIEEGEIKKKEVLISFLKKFRENYDLRFPVISLPEEKAYLSLITLPAIKEDEIRESLSFQIEDYIPLKQNEAVFDFEISVRDPETGHLDVLIVAFPKKIVNDYGECFEKAGFAPLAMELESLSLARALARKGNKENVMLVDFGKTRTTFAILSGENIRFTSTVPLGGKKIEEALSRVLGVDSFEAERIKKNYSLAESGKNEKTGEALFPIISSLKDEIEKYFNYWISHFSHIHQNIDPEIKEVFFSGGDANIEGLCEYLSQGLHVPVKIGNPWINIASFEDYVPEIERRKSLSYAVAIGLGLRALGGK